MNKDRIRRTNKMKTLKDKVQHPSSDEFNMYWEKDVAQAIKELEEDMKFG